jgi:hypothetical protein
MCTHLNCYLPHAPLPLPVSTRALRRFTILDPKDRGSTMSSSSGSESDMSLSNASQFATPDSDNELLVEAMAATTEGHFLLNVVSAVEG